MGEAKSSMTNLAHLFCHYIGQDIERVRNEYEDACIFFAGDLIHSLGQGRLAWFDTHLNPTWRYHAAVEIDGVIHDLWQEEPMPLDDYLKLIGATEVEYAAESE